MEPGLVETFIREFHIEINKQTQVLAQGITDKKRNLEKLQLRLDGLYDAIADGLRTPGLGEGENVPELRASLLSYCELDTWVMVEVHRTLMTMI